MKTHLLLLFCACVTLCGCHSYDVNSTQPVRYAGGVQIINLGPATGKSFNHNLEVFQSPAELGNRPWRKFAQLSHDGWPGDETNLINALIWKAKSLGADAVLLLPRQRQHYEFNPFAHSGVRYRFTAEAIAWQATPPASSIPQPNANR